MIVDMIRFAGCGELSLSHGNKTLFVRPTEGPCRIALPTELRAKDDPSQLSKNPEDITGRATGEITINHVGDQHHVVVSAGPGVGLEGKEEELSLAPLDAVTLATDGKAWWTVRYSPSA